MTLINNNHHLTLNPLPEAKQYEIATFAMGCFWKPQYIFSKIPGVLKTKVGYTGGRMKDPTYEDVCSDTTGHAEAVELEYDPNIVSYSELLKTFWDNHNPCTLNRQGPDVGGQYRSAIFYHTDAQKTQAEESLVKIQKNKAGTRGNGNYKSR